LNLLIEVGAIFRVICCW